MMRGMVIRVRKSEAWLRKSEKRSHPDTIRPGRTAVAQSPKASGAEKGWRKSFENFGQINFLFAAVEEDFVHDGDGGDPDSACEVAGDYVTGIVDAEIDAREADHGDGQECGHSAAFEIKTDEDDERAKGCHPSYGTEKRKRLHDGGEEWCGVIVDGGADGGVELSCVTFHNFFGEPAEKD